MKTTVILLSIILLSVFCLNAYAQTYGIRAGLNLSNMHFKYGNTILSQDFKMNPGFLLGPTADFPLSDYLSIETAALLSTKGFKTSDKETYQSEIYEYKSTLNLVYVDIPIALKGRIGVSDNTYLFLSAGPYVGIGISGKSKSESIYNGDKTSHEEEVKWGSDENNDMLKRPDFGLAFGGGVEIKSFQFGIFYNLGLANISAYAEDETKIKNRVLNISAGYRFIRN